MSESALKVTKTNGAQHASPRSRGPSGQALGYAYSASGDLAASTDPGGNRTDYSYDPGHHLLKAVGGSQPLQSFQYDSSGRLTSTTDALGHTTQVANDVGGQKQTVIDPNGQLTTVYTYDDLGDVLNQDQVFGGQTLTTTMTYDPVGRPLTRTDPLGHTGRGPTTPTATSPRSPIPSGRPSGTPTTAVGTSPRAPTPSVGGGPTATTVPHRA